MSTSPHGGLRVRRSYRLEGPTRHGVVIELDATNDRSALAVLQGGLHEQPEGVRLIHGYDLAPVGLGAWVGDRQIRLRVWEALLHDDGTITADDPADDATDLLVVDFDPTADGDALAALAETGRLFIAGPDMGPRPLVLDLDTALVTEVVETVGRPAT